MVEEGGCKKQKEQVRPAAPRAGQSILSFAQYARNAVVQCYVTARH